MTLKVLFNFPKAPPRRTMPRRIAFTKTLKSLDILIVFPKAPAMFSKTLVFVFSTSGAPSGLVVIFESLGRSFNFKAIFSRSHALTVVNNPKYLGFVISARTIVLVIIFKPLRTVFYAKPFILVIMFCMLSNIH